MISLRPCQQAHAEKLQRSLERWPSAHDGSDCGTGKGQPEGALILTTAGFKPNISLKVGDMIAASDGLFYPLGAVVIRGFQPLFRVHFSDRTSLLVDADHLHIVRTNNDRQRRQPWRVLSTLTLVSSKLRYGASGKSRNFDIPVVRPIQWEPVRHRIPPYILGVLLGDGGITCSCGVTIAELEMEKRIRAALPPGVELRKWKSRYAFGISSGPGGRRRSFVVELRRLGLMGLKSHAKFIPEEYLIDSVQNRVSLLRGLMDTDGFADTSAHFYTTSPQLRDGIIWLIRSLGGIPTQWTKRASFTHKGVRKVGRPCFVVCFSLKTFNPFSLSRKAAKWNAAPRDNGRWIDRIEAAGTGRTICLACGSPDGSYVTEHFVVTHNTYVGAWLAAAKQVRTLVVCPLSVVPTWQQILEDAGLEDGMVMNWESAWRKLGRKIPWGTGSYFEWSQEWPFFIFDECHRAQSRTSMQGKMLIAAVRQAQMTKGRILTVSATAADSPLKMGPLGFCWGLHSLDNYLRWLDEHGCPEIMFGPKDDPKKQWKKRIFLKSKEDEVLRALNEQIYGERGSRMRIADIPDFPTTQLGVRLLDGYAKEVARLSAELKYFYDNRTRLAALMPEERVKVTYLRQAMEAAKVPPLVDMIEDAIETSKVAVFCNFNQTVDALAQECAANKWKYGVIRGDQAMFARQQTIHSFQANNLDVVICNIQAGGVGVSLHALDKTPRTALICPTYNHVDLKQSFGRVHRDGGGNSRQFIVFFRGTVEEKVANTVQRKLDNLDTLNDADLDETAVQAELAI